MSFAEWRGQLFVGVLLFASWVEAMLRGRATKSSASGVDDALAVSKVFFQAYIFA